MGVPLVAADLIDGALGEAIAGDEEYEAEIYLRAVVCTTDGSHCYRRSTSGPLARADGLARELAAEMLEEGALSSMQEELA